jgi:hypothetical protein
VIQSWHVCCRHHIYSHPTRAFYFTRQDLEAKVVEACGGMPLALEIAGGHLGRHHSNMQYWQVRPKHKFSASFTAYGCLMLDLAQSIYV